MENQESKTIANIKNSCGHIGMGEGESRAPASSRMLSANWYMRTKCWNWKIILLLSK